MKSKEVLASVIHHQDKQKAYDRYCKRIFSNKQILARLLKEYIAEYKTLSLKEIMKLVLCQDFGQLKYKNFQFLV